MFVHGLNIILKFAGGPPTNSINISAMNRYPFADDLSQNNIQPTATTEKHLDIQPTATSKKHQVTTYEGNF